MGVQEKESRIMGTQEKESETVSWQVKESASVEAEGSLLTSKADMHTTDYDDNPTGLQVTLQAECLRKRSRSREWRSEMKYRHG